MTIDALATLGGNFLRGGPFFLLSPILGGVDDDGHHVYSLDPAGGVVFRYVHRDRLGHAARLWRPRAGVRRGDDQRGGADVGARAVKSAIERDTASGDGVFLAGVTSEGVDVQGHKDFDDVIHQSEAGPNPTVNSL